VDIPVAAQSFHENIRLVIWDLDETFWRGTVTEGGHHYVQAHHDLVITLARRGIISTICSANDFNTIQKLLEATGLWDYFVFPSIDWSAKAPRIKALIEQIGLRAPTVLFIDDNLQNLNQTLDLIPDINVALPAIIPALAGHAQMQGKDDAGLSRLHQYKLLEKRDVESRVAGQDTIAFLRKSDICVYFDYDVERHIDRAIELINRTNQLNFTKQRLPEDIEEARAALREALSAYQIQAGILRVQDRYGDYGYCGFYMIHSGGVGRRLRHFCFSCRILNMGVETWLYQRLGCPQIFVQGEVLTDLFVRRDIDWISVAQASITENTAAPPRALDYIYARGGCDLHAVTHYFAMVADTIYTEFNTVRDGINITFQHSMFARYAISGIAPEARAAMRALGYRDEDFQSFLSSPPDGERCIWLLSFWADLNATLFRHKATGTTLPAAIAGLRRPGVAGEGQPPDNILRDFDFLGATPEADFIENVRLVLNHAPSSATIFILLADDSTPRFAAARRRLNDWTQRAAAGFSNVVLLKMTDFVFSEKDFTFDGHHDRMVYYRVYEKIMRLLNEALS